MLRRLLVTLCAVVLIQETNLGSLIAGAECLEKCASDIGPGHCAPSCVSCTCGTHVNPVSPNSARLQTPIAADRYRFVEANVAAGDLHLPDILHVPKNLFA